MKAPDSPLPAEVEIEGRTWRLERPLKCARFSRVGIYAAGGERRIAKLYSRDPLRFLAARFLAGREVRNLQRLDGIPGVPRRAARIGTCGVAYEYVEGEPLERGAALRADFFPRLERLLAAIHARGVAHRDLSKRDNVLVASDGTPALIDFQIAQAGPDPDRPARGLRARFRRLVLERFQGSDRYHLLKHWRRCQPETLPSGAADALAHPGFWIRVHRILTWPYWALRRRLGRS